MPEFVAKKPDFNLAAIDKITERKGQVGVAWSQPDGTIRIKLNSFVVLDSVSQDLVLTLFPAQQDGNAKYKQRTNEIRKGVARPEPDDLGSQEDIPF